MRTMIRAAVMSLLCMTLTTGVVYPLVVSGIAQAIFPAQANGSLITQNGVTAGSALIGQSFDDPKYFWGRLSATGPVPYTAFNPDTLSGSSGSNLGPFSPALKDAGAVWIRRSRPRRRNIKLRGWPGHAALTRPESPSLRGSTLKAGRWGCWVNRGSMCCG